MTIWQKEFCFLDADSNPLINSDGTQKMLVLNGSIPTRDQERSMLKKGIIDASQGRIKNLSISVLDEIINERSAVITADGKFLFEVVEVD